MLSGMRFPHPPLLPFPLAHRLPAGETRINQPSQGLMNKFKKILLLVSSEQLSEKYFSVFQLFIKVFSKMSDFSEDMIQYKMA